jgi:hypothetical protein
MALPISLATPAPDIAVHGWAPLTVRVAWTLLCEGIRVRPRVLRDGRDYVLLHLEPDLPLTVAEDRATELTARFVARARRKTWQDPWPQDGAMPPSPRWRRILDRSLTPLTDAVFRQHYGDGRSLEQLEPLLAADRIALEAARGGLREVLRRAGCADGLPLDQWPNARVDRLLRRLAAFAPGPCPPMLEVVEGQHPDHIPACVRCDRATRLVHTEVLTAADLVPPADGARPLERVRVLALHLHPDGRHHRAALAKELGVPCFPVGEDLLLVDFAKPDEVREIVSLAAEVASPARDHLRGSVVEGPGRWSAHGLLGPLVDRAEAEVRSKTWGAVDTVGELPPRLPKPPSARRWWGGVAALTCLAAVWTGLAIHPAPPLVDRPIEVEFTPGRGGIWADFDVAEDANVTLIRQTDGEVDVVLRPDSPVDKAPYAVGDGRYRLHTVASAVLMVSSTAPLDGLDAMLASVRGADDPLRDLEGRIRVASPRADVQRWRSTH